MAKYRLNYIERHGKLRLTKHHVMWRWWELSALHKELFRMREMARTQARFCLCRQSHAILTEYIAKIDRLSLRVSRQMDKYNSWLVTMDYWLDNFEAAKARWRERQHEYWQSFSND